MLRLSSAQMKAFSQLSVSQFEERTLLRIRQFFVSFRNLSIAEGKELVRSGRNRAAMYGITSERDVAKYIGLMVALGRDFDSISRYGSILSDPRLESRDKLACLYEEATSAEEI